MTNRLKKIELLPNSVFKDLGWEWFLGNGEWNYLTSELIGVKESECEAFFEAGQTIYEMFLDTAEFVIEHNLYDTIGIPANMIEIIRHTWPDERHLHIYGRFDFAGGFDGLPIKLLEFNADTPTSLPETAIIQWAQLKANLMDEERQYNTAYEDLVDNFKKLKAVNPDLYPALLLTTIEGNPEDDHNTEVMGEAAKEAGFEVEWVHLQDVMFSPTEGIYIEDGPNQFRKFDFWFKLVPWEEIAEDMPDLLDILTDIVKKRLAVILNPAFTLLMQSKGLMKFMWDLHPNHPLLLKTSFDKPTREDGNYAYVEKVMLGREGQNVTIYDEGGRVVEKKDGEYGRFASVYQEYAKLNKDTDGNYYQAGVFYMTEAAALGFRREKQLIVDEDAEFLGHYMV